MSNQGEKRTRAIEWLMGIRKDQEPSQSKVEDWEKWIADPDHESTFDAVTRVWDRAGNVGPLPLPDPEELAADDYDGSEPIGEWTARREGRSRREEAASELLVAASEVPPPASTLTAAPVPPPQPRRWKRAMAVAAAASIAVFGWMAFPQIRSVFTTEPQFYGTGLAEHRTIELEDGSRLLLGAKTSLWVTFSRSRRIVVLERGEAMFDVAKDPSRPFAVHAGYGTITAVGTSFSVQRDREHVEVVVAEGIVRVEPRISDVSEVRTTVQKQPIVATLTKGQQVSYDEAGSGKISIARVDAELATAWREGRLQYVDEPLVNVIADVNRYSRRQILLDGPQAYDLRFTGVVFQDNTDRWVDQLTDVFPALEVVEASSDHMVLRSRSGASP